MEVRRVEREEAFSIMARSMMVTRGATRPDAQAAEVTSEAMRQGSSLVFHFVSLREVIEGLVGTLRVVAVEVGTGVLTSMPS